MSTILRLKYRTWLAFWVYGFSKNERDNISQEEEQIFKDLSQQMLSFSGDDIERLLQSGALVEVLYNERK